MTNWKKILFFSCIFHNLSYGEDWYQRWSSAGETWYERWMNLADQSASMAPEERTEMLGRALTIAKNRNMTTEQSEVFERIQPLILNTPSHARYYKKQIQSYTGRIDVRRDIRLTEFEILQYLPSPETVEALGELLFDEEAMDEYVEAWGRTNSGNPPPDFYIPLGNSLQAAVSLMNLPLKSKPAVKVYHGLYMDVEDIQSWKNWYNQIKEGRRTFSFEGDSNEYDLNGIALEAKNPDIPRVTKRPPVNGNAATESSRTSESTHLPWIAGTIITILVGISWVILKKRKAI